MERIWALLHNGECPIANHYMSRPGAISSGGTILASFKKCRLDLEKLYAK